MSKIPYAFDTPIPKYFREKGWFKSDNCLKFVTWAFARCSHVEHDICYDNQNITLKPFQFIFGRFKCSEETNMSEREVRTQQKNMESAGFLKKVTNRTPNRFTIYEWVTDCFSISNDQVKDQRATNKRPTSDHNLDSKDLKDAKDHQPQTPSEKKGEAGKVVSKEEKKKIFALMEASEKAGYPFSPAMIYSVFEETSGLAIQETMRQYHKRSKNLKPLDLPDLWFRKNAIKHHELELQKKDLQ